ncbi:MAG TPA: DsbA family oxidoreductase [Alphaproteobacteria bacterium]|nr:DsbA family oxidoreductase [Alphaproteobacteria bacterium]
MRIDIYSDTICPWCYIGKRRLERALAQRPDVEARIHWRAFQLNPWMPAGGVAREDYLRAKFGATDSQRIYANIREVGLGEGIEFRFDLMKRTPNTIPSHRLVAWAADQPDGNRQSAVVEQLFQTYFLEGGDLCDPAVLVAAAERAGLDPAAAADLLEGRLYHEEVVAEDATARRMGIQGVPCFIIDGAYAISGAQEPEYFLPLFDLISTGQAAAE